MSIDQQILNAQVLSANLAAQIAGVDAPESVVHGLLGINVFVGQQMFDSVSGQIVEVVSAGVQTVSVEPAGS